MAAPPPSVGTALETQIAFVLGGLAFVAGLMLGSPSSHPEPVASATTPARNPHTTRPAPTAAGQPRPTATPSPAPSPSRSPDVAVDPRVDPRDPTATRTSVPPVEGPEGERAASRLLQADVERGVQRLPHLGQGPLPNALRDLRPVLALAASWVERDGAARSWLAARKAAPAPAGSVAAEELATWTRLIEAARSVRQAIADPRARKQALARLKGLPPAVARDGATLLRAVDWLDHHQRWSRVGPLRKRVEKLQAELARVGKSALGRMLRDEALAVDAMLIALLKDPQGCLIAALTSKAVSTLPLSEYLRTRLNVLPRGAASTNMPGWGLMIELDKPLAEGALIEVQIPGRHTLRILPKRLKLDEQLEDVEWGQAKIIYIEVRPQGLLVRIPDAKPSQFMTRSSRPEEEVRYTVTLRGSARAKQVALARIPHRSEELFRGNK